MAEPQIIPARHGVATFVPAGQCIRITNTSGTQVVDTWAFALPQPAPKRDVDESTKAKEEASKRETAKAAEKLKSKSDDLPSQEEAEKATKDAHEQAEQQEAQKKSGWSSYVPSIPSLGLAKKEDGSEAKDIATGETQQQKNSKTWSSYFKPGKGFSSYIPDVATDTVSKFVNVHSRDTSKTYIQQLTDFSKTPVGAAGMSAFTGSGYSGSLYAGYQAWNAKNAADAPSVEFMSMSHTRSYTLHLIPKKNDTLVTNLREPILTVIEDKSPGIHDTLIPACDPPRYKALGVAHWEEHGSCAENLVLALKELNERAGLKGAKAIGADVTINSVPAPLNLFMNIPWTDGGDIKFDAPKGKAGDFIIMRAERDVVVVMSACPNDVNGINGDNIRDASFIVEEEATTQAIKRTQPKKKSVPNMTIASPKATTGTVQSTSSGSATATKTRPASPSVSSSKKATSQTPQPSKVAPPSKKPPPAKTPPTSAKPSNTSAQKASPAATRTTKQPAPPPVKPQQLDGAASAAAVERKKPRKLIRQPAQS